MHKTKGVFKVEIRKDCKVCGGELPFKFRRFCSKKCKTKFYNKINYTRQKLWATRKRGEYKPGKIKCLICGYWYIQVASHVFVKHKISAHEYKVLNDLPFKRGIVPRWYHDLKSNTTLSNGTILNLEKGAKMRYKKNDERAKEVTGWKGRAGSKGHPGYD